MSELLIELFSEEIPAVMQKGAEVGYHEIFSSYFKENEISYDTLDVHVGPRRVTIMVTGLPATMPAKAVDAKGPRVGGPDVARDKFCQAHGLTQDQLEVREVKGAECYFAVKTIPERAVADLLKDSLAEPVGSYVWPKSMYWGRYEIKWVRPLHNILCLFDGAIVPFEFGHLVANNKSYGHRFMSPGELTVSSIENYRQQLETAYVVLERETRLKIVEDGLAQKADELGLLVKEDPKLLEEVAGLAEYPLVLSGNIEEKFLKVPSPVLVTSMRSHQKYFSCLKKGSSDEDMKFAPHFLFVTNIKSSDQQVIISGNEKVLSARLADALYFYEQDLKISLESRAGRLANVVFHEKLGSLGDKQERLVKICAHLAPQKKEPQEAAKICKSDILSEVVGEFPSLQGIMGYYYAIEEGRSEEVAVAIRDHYKPVGANDDLPEFGSAATILALAEKLDSLAGLMIAGEKPTGSKDPYALRRAALGIIRIILGNQMQFNLYDAVDFAVNLQKLGKNDHAMSTDEIVSFIEERVRHYFKSTFDQAVIKAALDLDKQPDLVTASEKVKALSLFVKEESSRELLNSYKRACNILKDKQHGSVLDAGLLSLEEEKELYGAMVSVRAAIEEPLKGHDYTGAFNCLAELNKPLAMFFENVMVMDEDASVAANRLALLVNVRELFESVAKFGEL